MISGINRSDLNDYADEEARAGGGSQVVGRMEFVSIRLLAENLTPYSAQLIIDPWASF